MQCSLHLSQTYSPVSPTTRTKRCSQTTNQNQSQIHITPILASLHWLAVKYRIDFKTLLITYKALHGPYISELLHPYSPSRPLRSSDLGPLFIPRSLLKSNLRVTVLFPSRPHPSETVYPLPTVYCIPCNITVIILCIYLYVYLILSHLVYFDDCFYLSFMFTVPCTALCKLCFKKVLYK